MNDPVLPRAIWYPRVCQVLRDCQLGNPELVLKMYAAQTRPDLSSRLNAIDEEMRALDAAPWSQVKRLLEELLTLVEQVPLEGVPWAKLGITKEFVERLEKSQGIPGALVHCASLGGMVWIRFSENFEPPDDGRLVYDVDEALSLLGRDRVDCDVAVSFKHDGQRLVQEGPEPKK